MSDEDRSDMLARFPACTSISQALKLYPKKDVIVFCKGRYIIHFINEMSNDFPGLIINHNRQHVILPDNRIIMFKHKYEDGRGYDRNHFVMVDKLWL